MTLLYPDTSLPQTLVYPIVKSDTSLPLTLLYLLLKKTPVYLGTLLLRDIKYNLLYKENGGNIKPGPTLFSVRDAHLLHYPTYKKLCFLNVHYRWKCGHKIDCFCHNFGRNGLIELIFYWISYNYAFKNHAKFGTIWTTLIFGPFRQFSDKNHNFYYIR